MSKNKHSEIKSELKQFSDEYGNRLDINLYEDGEALFVINYEGVDLTKEQVNELREFLGGVE